MYLKSKAIENAVEPSFETQTGHVIYQLWVMDEDRLEEAIKDLERFQKEPSNAEFDPLIQMKAVQEEVRPKEEKALRFTNQKTPLTLSLLILCSIIFFYNAVEQLPFRKEGLSDLFLLTPIQVALLYDVPPPIAALEDFLEKEAEGGKIENLSSEVQVKLQQIEKIPYWRGFYDWVILKMKGEDTSLAEGPLFLRIRQGEAWRLFTPALLHSEFLHILFNMIWLWVLGRPIEQRIGFSKTLLLTLVSGIFSNTIQYLMSGPFFIGYSGIVMALAGFTWMREKIAPWEGYPLNRTTIIFLLLFIGSMFLLSFTSFFLHLWAGKTFAPNIANTAHIGGAVIGAVLARFSFFAQKASIS
ncbi:MAG: rhomboid family intramembrane serine protease [Chlamydiae bacterium]|nr:rhomboid family intramembrane serine protease [Chlamydiota bacterium]